MTQFPLSGVFSAVLTPMKNDLVPDDAALAAHCQWLLANGCDGLAVLGTTGEANSLCLKERIRILEHLAENGIPGEKLMPGTGACALTDAVTLTKRAVELGAGGVLMLPPFYYKNVSDDGLFAYYSEVIQRVGDDGLKVYLYHFPQMSAVPLSLSLIERLVAAYPDTVVGMKDSSGDFDNMKTVCHAVPGFAVFTGWDHLLKPLLEEGGAGCITAVANIAAPLLAKVYRRGPDAQAAHDMLNTLRSIVQSVPLVAGLKEMMARHTGGERWRNIRPPLMALPANDAKGLMAKLGETGYVLPPA